MKTLIAFALFAGMPAAHAVAQSGGTMPLVRAVPYVPDQLVTVQAATGYAIVIELAPDERIDSIVVGNSAAWQVTASKRGDQVVVKPLSDAAATDMVVTSDMRRYVFLLQPTADALASPFVMRFQYPPPSGVRIEPAAPATAYRFRGNRQLLPMRMSDDGQRTRIHWSSETPLPAVSAVDAQGHEAIVNGRMVEGDYLIDGVASRYVFRRGQAEATAIRTAVSISHRE